MVKKFTKRICTLTPPSQCKAKKKIVSIFPEVHPKNAMRDTFFVFYFINIKTAMRNHFINRTRRYTQTLI